MSGDILLFSHARSDINEYLQRVYDDLRAEVRLLVGSATADAGLRGTVGIEAGEQWGDVVVEQLITSRSRHGPGARRPPVSCLGEPVDLDRHPLAMCRYGAGG